MDQQTRSLHVARLIAGDILFTVEENEYILKPFSRMSRYRASLLYKTTYNGCVSEGVPEQDYIIRFLIENDLWGEEDERKFLGLKDDIEEMKVKIYDLFLKSNEREYVRKQVRRAETQLVDLSRRRAQFNHLTCDGIATRAQYVYLISSNLQDFRGDPVDVDAVGIDNILDELNKIRLSDSELRLLSRTDPWRNYWNIYKQSGRGLFDCAAVDMTDEQQGIISWSNLYDNIYSRHDRPNDDIMQDDDSLDGWLITQRRQHETEQLSRDIESKLPDSIRNCQEILIPVGGQADADKIERLNSPVAKFIKAQRQSQLEKKPIMTEKEFIDFHQRGING